jgi:murein DD-endopeptidase MepM/ murein hydrolase activator NlpD
VTFALLIVVGAMPPVRTQLAPVGHLVVGAFEPSTVLAEVPPPRSAPKPVKKPAGAGRSQPVKRPGTPGSPVPPAKPPAQPAAQVMEVGTTELNVRTDPSTNRPPAGHLNYGDKVTVVSVANGWSKLDNGTYVSSAYLYEPGKRPPLCVRPAAAFISSTYGDTAGRAAPHKGVDFGGHPGENVFGRPIYAARGGIVKFAGFADPSGFGAYVEIEVDGGRGQVDIYGHIESWSVHSGDPVRTGQVIATIGNRGGASHGAHLHYAVEATGHFDYIDPRPILVACGVDLYHG